MLIMLLGIFYLLLGIWGLIFTIRNRRNMPTVLFGIPQKKFEVLNKAKFNHLMLKQSYIFSLYIIFLGIFSILTKSMIIASLSCITPFISLTFSALAKRYVKIM